MRISLLREYQALVKWMSVRRAAESLHVSPSSLSKHMVELERETGLSLIDRSDSCRISLTRVGKEFASEISLILPNYDAAISSCRAMQKRLRKTLRIQELLQNEAMVRIYSLASEYAKERGDVDLDFSMLGGENVEGMSAPSQDLDITINMRFTVDVGFVERMEECGVEAVPILTEPTAVWGSVNNQDFAALDESATFQQLSRFPIVTAAGKIFDYFGQALAALYEVHGVTPKFRSSYAALSFSTYFLEDFGSCLLFATRALLDDARIRSRNDLRVIVLEDPSLQVTTYLCGDRGNDMALDFLAFVRRALDRGLVTG